MGQETVEITPPLTVFSEDERLFRDSVREFADAKVRPLVREMDEQAKMSAALVRQLFELGVMGIEVPETHGGAGGRFFHSVLAVEELSRVDPSVGVLVDVQNTLVINALLRWANDEMKQRFLPQARRRRRRRLRAIGSRLGQRRVRADDARPRGRRRLRAQRTEALDHQRQRGGRVHRVRHAGPVGRLPRHHRVPRRTRVSRASPSARRKTSSGIRASSTCELMLDDCHVPRANVLGELGKGYKIAIETLNEGRIGIGAQMLGLARGALDRRSATRRSASSSARRSPSSRACSFSSPVPPPSSRPRG